MNELYEMIEKKIKESGYPRPISGSDVYDDICDRSREKRTVPMWYYRNLMMMRFSSTTSR